MSHRINILTIDLEDWFHILENDATKDDKHWVQFESRIVQVTEMLLSIFEEYEQHATFFVLGWIAERYPQLVERIAKAGHEIACHSNRHRLVYEMTPQEFLADTEAAATNIEAATGQRPRAYRAPGFSITRDTPWAFEILADLGFDTDCSVFPASRAHGGLVGYGPGLPGIISTNSGTELRELPMSSHNFFGCRLVYGGGGYFRLTPGWLGRLLFSAAEYNMTYFHPRDFDTGQPIVPGLSPVRRFKSYVGINSTRSKLENLISSQRMMTLEEAVGQIDWGAARRIEIKDICSG